MPASETTNLPEDPAALKALLRAAQAERDRAEQGAAEHAQRAEAQAALAQEKAALAAQQTQRADELYLQNLRLQLQLERYQKWYYGPRADRLKTRQDLGQALLAYMVASKFADYLPLYRLENIFAGQGFEISRATQSVWRGDVADLVEPLCRRMAERMRASHVVATDDTVLPMLSAGKAPPARMWVYLGDAAHPYNVFDFTLRCSRDGPQEFLKNFTGGLLADAYGGYNGVVAGNALTRAGCWSHYPENVIIRGRCIDPCKIAGSSMRLSG